MNLITERGYQEQAQSFENMQEAATMAVSTEKMAGFGADISAGMKIAGGLALL